MDDRSAFLALRRPENSELRFVFPSLDAEAAGVQQQDATRFYPEHLLLTSGCAQSICDRRDDEPRNQ